MDKKWLVSYYDQIRSCYIVYNYTDYETAFKDFNHIKDNWEKVTELRLSEVYEWIK